MYARQSVDLVCQFKEKFQLPQRYFLSVGTNEPRKNLGRLISAFEQMKKKSRYGDIGLVLIGGKGWLNKHLNPKELNKKGIFPLGFLPEKELPVAYSGALAFVYPSLYEGFGLPLLESMGCGVPVITSELSSIPEVVGQSGLYVDPLSVSSIQTQMERMADQTELRHQLATMAEQQSRQFSWEKTAQQTEEVYQKVLMQG